MWPEALRREHGPPTRMTWPLTLYLMLGALNLVDPPGSHGRGAKQTVRSAHRLDCQKFNGRSSGRAARWQLLADLGSVTLPTGPACRKAPGPARLWAARQGTSNGPWRRSWLEGGARVAGACCGALSRPPPACCPRPVPPARPRGSRWGRTARPDCARTTRSGYRQANTSSASRPS